MAGLMASAPTQRNQKSFYLYCVVSLSFIIFQVSQELKVWKRNCKIQATKVYKNFKIIWTPAPPKLLWTICKNLMGLIKIPLFFMQEWDCFLWSHGYILINSNLPRILPEELLGCGFFFSVSVLHCCKLFY